MKNYLILFTALFLQGIVTAQTAAKQNPLARQLDSLFRQAYTTGLPGASVAVIENGNTIFKNSYGESNMQTKAKLTTASQFNICSLTKQFTAIAILQLQQQGLISLDDKLSKFFPDMNIKVANHVTIQNLLTHSGGLIDHYRLVNTTNMHHAHDSDVYAAIKNQGSVYFTPGSRFLYSNSAFCLLALIIEKLSHTSYNNYMAAHIFKPAGMLHTLVWNEHASIPDEVTAYTKDSAGAWHKSGADENIFFSTEGDGGIYTTIEDYLKWFAALQSGTVFSKALVEQARSLHYVIDEADHVGYGFGWFIDEQELPHKVYHSGSNGGFRTYSFTIPDKNFLIVIFSNRDDINVEDLAQKVLKIVMPATKPFIPIEVLTS